MPAKVFGVATFTGLTGLTGAVLTDFTVSADSEVKELRGNPSSSIIDVRTLPNAEVMTVTVAFEALVEPDSLIGDSLTLTATSEETVSQAVTGKVTSAELRGTKDDWWTYSVTIRKTT